MVPFHTSPGASVTMRVADRSFGPVTADRQGPRRDPDPRAARRARRHRARRRPQRRRPRDRGRSAAGAVRRAWCVLAPPTLDVGSFSEIVLLAVEPDGAPANPAGLTLSASAGLLHPLGPRSAGRGALPVRGAAPAGQRRRRVDRDRGRHAAPAATDMAVALRVGAPAQLAISPSTHRLVVGSGDAARVAVSAHDAFGNPTSASGVEITVDGRPRPVAIAAGGLGTLTVDAPAKFDGKERVIIDARLGAIRASEELHVTGGAPARLTLGIRDARLVADGHQSTELRVQAVDRNGTPTAVPGLSWDTPEGRIRHVRMPRDGEYVAEYVPDRTRDPQRQVVAVMATQALRANAALDVSPPPVRVRRGGARRAVLQPRPRRGPGGVPRSVEAVADSPPRCVRGRNRRVPQRGDLRHGARPDEAGSPPDRSGAGPRAGAGPPAPLAAVRDVLRAGGRDDGGRARS